MALPQRVKSLAERKLATYCCNCVPESEIDMSKIAFRIRGDYITLYEHSKSDFDPEEESDFKVAQFRYNQRKRTWSLYWADRREKWHQYDEVKPTRNIDDLLDEIDQDPGMVFWG